jgi:hypothetical protein
MMPHKSETSQKLEPTHMLPEISVAEFVRIPLPRIGSEVSRLPLQPRVPLAPPVLIFELTTTVSLN